MQEKNKKISQSPIGGRNTAFGGIGDIRKIFKSGDFLKVLDAHHFFAADLLALKRVRVGADECGAFEFRCAAFLQGLASLK